MNVAVEDYKAALGDELKGLTEEQILLRMERDKRLAIVLWSMWTKSLIKEPPPNTAVAV